MAIKFIKRDDIEEYDAEKESKKIQGHRSKEITNVRWRGTTGNPATKLVRDFRNRVISDGGIAEALNCLQAQIYKLIVS